MSDDLAMRTTQLPSMRRRRNVGAPVGLEGDEGLSVALEHGVDRLDMGLAQSAEHQLGTPCVAVQYQLGDDLVRTGKIHHPHVTEVDDRDRAAIRLEDLFFDVRPHRGSGRAGHEIGIALGDHLSQDDADVDMTLHHRVTRSGIVI